jgi:hypothetical protein
MATPPCGCWKATDRRGPGRCTSRWSPGPRSGSVPTPRCSHRPSRPPTSSLATLGWNAVAAAVLPVPGYFLPTPIGNILRAAECRPADNTAWTPSPSGRTCGSCCPRPPARSYAQSAPASTPPWPPPPGDCCSACSPPSPPGSPHRPRRGHRGRHHRHPARAQAFCDLIEAAYDLHHTSLYQQLRWPLPANPGEEHACRRQLTAYLRRGSDATTPTFTPPTLSPLSVTVRESIE